MPIPFLLALLAVIVAAAIVALTLAQLVAISDLENDQVNAHDATRTYNTAVLPLLVAEALLVLVALVDRNWLLAAVAAFSFAASVPGSKTIDSVDAYRVLKTVKDRTVKKTAAATLMMAITLWVMVRVIVNGIISSHGKAAAAAVLREAAASLH